MAEESPIMRAWREFAMADPEDCDREWEAYLALVGGKSAASVSSPTSSTSSQAPATATRASPATSASAHPRVPCSAAAIAIPTATAASPAVLRVKHDSPKDDLSPEARRMYDYLVGNSTSVSEESAPRWDQEDVYPPLAELRRAQMTDMQWAALSEWEKDLWEMKHLPEKERMNSIEGVVMWLPAAQRDQRRKELMEELLRFGEPAPKLDSSTTPTSTTLDISTVLQAPTELDGVPVAVITTMGSASARAVTSTHVPTVVALDSTPASLLTHEMDPCSMMPTTCSTVCIGGDTSMMPTPSCTAVVPTSSVSIPILRAIVSATFMGPAAGDLLKGGNDVASSSPTYVAAVVPVTTMTAALCPAKPCTEHKLICVESLQKPWTRLRRVTFLGCNRSKDMPGAFHLDGFVLERMQLMLWAEKSPWPPPPSNMSTSCRVLTLQGTLDNMQLLSGECQVLKTWGLKCSAVPIVVTFVPGVQKAQLKPTLLNWPDPFCFDKRFLSASTLDFSLAWRAAPIVWNWCCLDNLYCYLGSTNLTLEEEQGQVLLRMPWQLFRYHWEVAFPMKPCQGTFWCELLSIGNTWYCLQYEHLKQGRPPDQTTEFLGVQLQLESRNMGGITLIKENLPPQLLEVYSMLGRLTSNHCPAELFAIEYWLIPWEPGDDNPGHNLREKIISLAITCELLYSASVDDKLPADHYWLWCMKCVELSRVRVEAYFSLPSVDQGRLKCTKLQNPSCWNGWHSSSLLIHWLHVPCIQLFWGLLCAVQGYVCSSTSVFFANLNGVSAVQHQYTCTKVLMVADYKEWIHHHILLGLLDLALTDWKTWISGLYLWAIYFGASTCGRDVSTLWWLQFAIMNSLGSQDEYTSSFTIGTSLDLMEMGIYYRSTHYTEVHILDAISLWLNTSTSLHGGKLYWLLGLHSSWDQFRTESENCFDSQYFEWQIPWYSILYASSSCGLALFLERFDQDWVLSSPVGYIIQYGSEHILQFVEYNGLTWKYFSYKEIHSEHATHYVSVASPNFGGNGGLIMGFSVKTMEPQQTKLLYCSLLIQWPGVPISAKASFYTTVQNATQNWGVDICGQNWQDSTKLQNHSCWNEWSFLLHIPVHFKLKKYWDPRGVELRLSEAAFVLWLIMLWDPGGSTWCRLEVKPNFKEGGLSATSLVGWLVGRYYWAMAYSGARWECYREQYILGRHLQETWLGTERKRRLRPRLVGACVVCAVFLFLFLLLEP